MRELKWVEYCNEVKECENELEYTIKSILKKKGESVPYNFIMMVKDALRENGHYEICNLVLKNDCEKVIVHDKCEKVDFEEYKENIDEVKIINENDGVYDVTFIGSVDRVILSGESTLFEIFTTTEAAHLWGLNESTVRKAIKSNKFKLGIDFRKAGRVTLITKEAMIREYGDLKTE